MAPLFRIVLLLGFATTAFGAPPVFDNPTTSPPSFPRAIPVGKALIFPITATDADGDPLTYKVTSSNPKVIVRAKTGEPSLKLAVTYGSPTQTGEMIFALFREWTPVTGNFIGGFAQSGFFDNIKFHRVVSGFAIQGGDPLGTGSGGPGMTANNPATAFKFENEFQAGLIFTGRGQLAMANSGFQGDFDASNGSQFFISLAQPRFLDFKHTIFGQLLRGWATMDAIAAVPVENNPSGELSKPVTDVIITSATVEPNNHDAVLMLSATGLASNVTITVTATDPNGETTTTTFPVSAVADTSNSPPVVLGVTPFSGPKETQLNFGIRSFDLEFDYPSFNSGVLAGNAEDLTQGFNGAVRGNAGFEGQARLAFQVSQFNVGQGGFEDPIVKNFALIGIGDRPVQSLPLSVSAAPGAFTGVIARFKDTDISGSAANFTTVINWGDGTPEQTGTLVHDTTVPGSSTYSVTGTHTYAKAGIYTIVVTTTGNKGAVGIARNPAIITSGPIVAVGQQFDVRGPTLANRVLATFTDSGALVRPVDYTATVDWGDGVTSKGVVAKGKTGFVVRGTHVYKDAEPFAISVCIHKSGTAPTADAYAWSTVNVFGFTPPRHLPPFPMAHLIGAWNSGPTKQVTAGLTGLTITPAALRETLNGAFVVINSGNKTSPATKLRYYLSRAPVEIAAFSVASPVAITTASPHGLTTGNKVTIVGVLGGTFSPAINGTFTATVVDSTHFTVPVASTNASVSTTGTIFPGSTQLTVNGLPEITVTPFGAGLGGTGQFTIGLPVGDTGIGKFIVGQLIYSDPIIDASRVDKVVASGPISGVYPFNLLSTVGQDQDGRLFTSEAGGTITFNIVLDTEPTANVTLGLACLVPNAAVETVSTEATVSPSSITFTPANWKTGIPVTVTGANDTIQDGNAFYELVIRKPTSTDTRFTAAPPIVFTFGNLDND